MEKHVEASETVGTAQTLNEFGVAIMALKEGKMVARLVWAKEKSFIFRQVPSKVAVDIVPKMTSLPFDVKNEIISREDQNTIRYQDQIAKVYPDNTIVAWNPSCSDILANDWLILS